MLLHGWGFDRAVMEPLADALDRDHPVALIDLPGFAPGDARPPGRDLDALAEAVLADAPARAHWLGWSLGGLVALAAARRSPDRVQGVDLLAATPRFPEAAGWPGIAAGALADFIAEVERDAAAAHRRFLGFQVAGSEGARDVLRRLRTLGARRGLPAAPALADGLAILRDSDLRGPLAALSCPVRALLGRADPLVPASVAGPLRELGVEVRLIDGAGHVPFLSHPETVQAMLDQAMPIP